MSIQPPECLKKPLLIPQKLLMGAGPSNTSPRVLHALSQPTMGHLHLETTHIMDEIKEGVKYIFQTRNTLTLCVSGAGHAAIEAVMCNLLEPGEVVLVAMSGIWGGRATDIASRYGAVPKQIKTELGDNLTLKDIEEGLMKHRPVLFFVVQGESSTGCYQPLEGIGDLCRKYNCLLAVDTVASLGGVPVKMDEWGIDAIYTGSQKCLSAPAGITPMSFSKRAEEKIFARKTPVMVNYLDMKLLGDYWFCFGRPRIYHHTISTSLIYALREALAIYCEEGIENSLKRHHMCANRLHEGLSRLGLQLFVPDAHKRLPTVTAIKIPVGINWKDVTGYAMDTYRLEISGGVGPTTGKVFRIGLMGSNATINNVDYTLQVLEESLKYARSKSSKL